MGLKNPVTFGQYQDYRGRKSTSVQSCKGLDTGNDFPKAIWQASLIRGGAKSKLSNQSSRERLRAHRQDEEPVFD